jgi:phage terminase large subunit
VYSSYLTAGDIAGLFNRVTTDTIMADNQARQLIDTLYYDYNMSNVVPCEKGAGSVMAGIKKIQSYDEIIVTTTSKNTLSEFSQYAYALNRDKIPVDKPKDEYNHAIDALRYALQSPEVQFYCFV